MRSPERLIEDARQQMNEAPWRRPVELPGPTFIGSAHHSSHDVFLATDHTVLRTMDTMSVRDHILQLREAGDERAADRMLRRYQELANRMIDDVKAVLDVAADMQR